MRPLLLFVIWCFAILPLTAQRTNIEVLPQDEAISELFNRFVEINQAPLRTVKGWRIQLLATTDRQQMDQSLQRFRSLYPNIPATWAHDKPYYKIHAGAFESKLEALRMLYLVKRDYPGAYPIVDKNIKPAELLY